MIYGCSQPRKLWFIDFNHVYTSWDTWATQVVLWQHMTCVCMYVRLSFGLIPRLDTSMQVWECEHRTCVSDPSPQGVSSSFLGLWSTRGAMESPSLSPSLPPPTPGLWAWHVGGAKKQASLRTENSFCGRSEVIMYYL